MTKAVWSTIERNLMPLASMTVILHSIIIVLQQLKIIPPLHGYFNNGSTFGNPDMVGSYISVVLPLCLIQNQKWVKVGYMTMITGVLVLIFIQARSALLALILCSIFWLIKNKDIKRKHFQVVVSLSLFLIAGIIFWHPDSVYGRFFIWFISLKMIFTQPLGWGIFAFEKYYPEFQASYVESNNIPNFINPDIVHSSFNEFLNIGVTLGIPGLLFFCILVIHILFNSLKLKSPFFYPLFIFIVISLFYFPFKIAPLLAIIIPLIGLVSVANRKILQFSFSKIPYRSFIIMMGSLSLLLSTMSILDYKNYKLWQKAVLLSQNEKTLDLAETQFLRLYPRMNENGRFLISYSNMMYRKGDNITALNLLEEANIYFSDIALSLNLARLYEAAGNNKKSEEYYNLAENIAPKRFWASYKKILFLFKIGRKEEAYFLSKKLIDKPINESTYADPLIIKSRLSKIILEYEINSNRLNAKCKNNLENTGNN